jgi:cytochrome oxidase assembly protein ShyY1
LQAKYAAGQRAVVELTEANAATLTQYQRVSAHGHYVSAQQILLDSMPSAMGQPGYRVVTPFELEQGGWLLVDRGWHRPGTTRSDLPDVAVGENARTVTGQLSVLPRPGVRLAATPEGSDQWPRVLNYPDQSTVEAALGRKVLPGLVLLDLDQPDGFERVWQARIDMGSERHLSYAVQWFGFAIAAIALFVVLGFRRGQQLDEQSK